MLDSLNDLIHNKYHQKIIENGGNTQDIEQDFIEDLASYGFSKKESKSIFQGVIQNSIK